MNFPHPALRTQLHIREHRRHAVEASSFFFNSQSTKPTQTCGGAQTRVVLMLFFLASATLAYLLNCEIYVRMKNLQLLKLSKRLNFS